MLRVYYRWSGVPCDRNIMYKGCLKTKNDFVRNEIIIIFVCTNKSNGSMNDLFKANVEALARNESGGIMCLQYMGSMISLSLVFIVRLVQKYIAQ